MNAREVYNVIISKSDAAIGIDWGNAEKVETVPAAKSVSFACKTGCGVTGPWSFSQMAAGNDEISTDGCSLVTVGEKSSKTLVD